MKKGGECIEIFVSVRLDSNVQEKGSKAKNQIQF